jgi:hypothetical protein
MRKVTPQEALSLYLGLGAERSLTVLRQRLIDDASIEPVALRTLADWSSRDGWVRAAEEFDAKASARLVARTQTAVVRAGFDRVMSLTMLAQRCLDLANAATLDPSSLNAADIRSLASTAIEAIKSVEVLTGGVSDRTERAGGMATEARELLRQLEAQKRARVIDITPPSDTG